MLAIMTDGSCKPANPGPGGCAAVLFDEDTRKVISYRKLSLGHSTNNIAELTAVKLGIELMLESGQAGLKFYTDSQYAIGILSKGWKAQKNVELVTEIRNLLIGKNIKFEWVKGHSSNQINEFADGLAKQAAEGV